MVSHFLFYFSLAFDFKGTEDGGNVFQLISFALTIATATHIILKEKIFGFSNRRYKLVGNLLVVHLVLTFVVALIQGVEIGRYLRIVLPYFFLVLGYFVGIRSYAKFGFDKTLYILTSASLVAAVFTLFYGLATGDFADNGIRYQVLSPMLFILVPVLAHKVFILKKDIKIASTLMLAILILILVSATRSWLVAYIGIVVLALSISKVSSIWGLIKGGIRGVIFGGILVALALPILFLVMPEVISRFGDRIFSAREIGFDITSATRIAEMDYQINAWLSDIPSFLFGKGLGASYGFSGESLVQLVDLFGGDDMHIDWWFAGHNFWVYSLFTQGALLGWVMPALILSTLFATLKNIMDKRIKRDVDKSNSSAVMLCSLIFASVILSTIGGNALASRMLAEYIGVFLSLAIVLTANDSVSSDSNFRFKSARKISIKRNRFN